MSENDDDKDVSPAAVGADSNHGGASESKSTSNIPKVDSGLLKSPKYSNSSSGQPAAADDAISSPLSGEKKRVSFSHLEDSADAFQAVQKGQAKATRSARVGKADPMRDLGIFLIIILLFYFIASGLDSVGTYFHEEDPASNDVVQELKANGGGRSSFTRLKQMRNAIGAFLKQQYEANPRREEECDLFYAKSSIPNTGLGVFAGRNYTTGEEIMVLSGAFMKIGSATSPLWIAPESLLFKHHPTLPNIQPSQPLWTTTIEPGSSGAIVMKTSQPIVAGEELLLSFNQHLHSVLPEWFDQVFPVHDDYVEADFLIMEARRTFREPLGPRGRKANQNQQTGMVGQALRMVQRVVARYRPAVSKLLPIALQALSKYTGRVDEVTSLYFALHNQTLNGLARNGLCLSDVTVANTDALTTNRSVTKGGRVHPLPVLVRFKSEGSPSTECQPEVEGAAEGSCPPRGSTYGHCWSRPDSLVELCPLFPLPKMDFAPTGSDDVNIELQWSSWYDATDTTEMDLSIVENKKQRLEQVWILDLMALRDVTNGDKLTIGMEQDGLTGDWILPKQVMPAKWFVNS